MLEHVAVFRITDGFLLRRLEIVEDEEFRRLDFIFNWLHVAEMWLLDHLLAETTFGLATFMLRLSLNDLTAFASEHLSARRELHALLLVLVLKILVIF